MKQTLLNMQVLLFVVAVIQHAVAENMWDEAFSPVPSPSVLEPVTPDGVKAKADEAPPQDATYVVKKGDTLWDLSFEFLGDPFRWPELWHGNPAISNPDRIYPGDRLSIPSRRFVSQEVSPAVGVSLLQSSTLGALATVTALKDTLAASEGYLGDSDYIASLRTKNILHPRFLATTPFLWMQKDASGLIYPGNATVCAPLRGAAYQLFSTLSITKGPGSSYSIGDTVDIYKSIRFLYFNDKTANLVQRVGRAVVCKDAAKSVDAELFEMSDAIGGGERVAPVTYFTTMTIDTLIEPDVAISALVSTRVESTESPYLYQSVIVDKGSNDGVRVGDLFGVYHRKGKTGSAHLAIVGVVGHVGAASSTLVIISMTDNSLDSGDQAILLKRTLFTEKGE